MATYFQEELVRSSTTMIDVAGRGFLHSSLHEQRHLLDNLRIPHKLVTTNTFLNVFLGYLIQCLNNDPKY